MWGRDSRVFDDYNENSFNNLYGFLCHASECGDYTEWERAVAKKAKEKVESYSAIAESSEEPGKLYVRIGWFGEELRDLLSLFVWNFKLPGGGGNHFAELVEKLKAREADPLYEKRMKLKKFSENMMFCDPEKILGKSRNVLAFLGEKSSPLSLAYDDFPSRRWVVERKMKKNVTEYEIEETAEGWSVKKLVYDSKALEEASDSGSQERKCPEPLETKSWLLNCETLELKEVQPS